MILFGRMNLLLFKKYQISKTYQRTIICIMIIAVGIFFPGKKIDSAEDWENESYIQSLPDKSFAVVEKKPDGQVIRLLPHHDKQGHLVILKVEESLNRVFELDIEYQEKARDHLLGEYYEYMANANVNAKVNADR